jgi:hypothetical protein
VVRDEAASIDFASGAGERCIDAVFLKKRGDIASRE